MGTRVTIGNKDYLVKELTFDTLARVWPYIDQINSRIEQINRTGKQPASPTELMNLAVATIALMVAQDDPELQAFYDSEATHAMTEQEKEALVIGHIRRRITSKQALGLEPYINEIMSTAGFDKVPTGDNAGNEAASPSTATGTDSSPNSLPQDAKAEAGTE